MGNSCMHRICSRYLVVSLSDIVSIHYSFMRIGFFSNNILQNIIEKNGRLYILQDHQG